MHAAHSLENTSLDSALADSIALEYILLGDLRDLLEEADPEGQSLRWLVAVLDALLTTLPQEMALKSAGGYLQPVLDQYPNWSGLVGDLATEKQMLFEKLADLRFQLHRPGAWEMLADEIRHDLTEWMNHWTAHVRHERRILQTAFTVDFGCGD